MNFYPVGYNFGPLNHNPYSSNIVQFNQLAWSTRNTNARIVNTARRAGKSNHAHYVFYNLFTGDSEIKMLDDEMNPIQVSAHYQY